MFDPILFPWPNSTVDNSPVDRVFARSGQCPRPYFLGAACVGIMLEEVKSDDGPSDQLPVVPVKNGCLRLHFL